MAGEWLGEIEYRTIELTTHRDDLVWGHSAVLGLDVCALPYGNLRFYDPASGQWLRTLHEESTARQEAETVLREEAAARQDAVKELRLLREQLERYQAGGPGQPG